MRLKILERYLTRINFFQDYDQQTVLRILDYN